MYSTKKPDNALFKTHTYQRDYGLFQMLFVFIFKINDAFYINATLEVWLVSMRITDILNKTWSLGSVLEYEKVSNFNRVS